MPSSLLGLLKLSCNLPEFLWDQESWKGAMLRCNRVIPTRVFWIYYGTYGRLGSKVNFASHELCFKLDDCYGSFIAGSHGAQYGSLLWIHSRSV